MVGQFAPWDTSDLALKLELSRCRRMAVVQQPCTGASAVARLGIRRRMQIWLAVELIRENRKNPRHSARVLLFGVLPAIVAAAKRTKHIDLTSVIDIVVDHYCYDITYVLHFSPVHHGLLVQI